MDLATLTEKRDRLRDLGASTQEILEVERQILSINNDGGVSIWDMNLGLLGVAKSLMENGVGVITNSYEANVIIVGNTDIETGESIRRSSTATIFFISDGFKSGSLECLQWCNSNDAHLCFTGKRDYLACQRAFGGNVDCLPYIHPFGLCDKRGEEKIWIGEGESYFAQVLGAKISGKSVGGWREGECRVAIDSTLSTNSSVAVDLLSHNIPVIGHYQWFLPKEWKVPPDDPMMTAEKINEMFSIDYDVAGVFKCFQREQKILLEGWCSRWLST